MFTLAARGGRVKAAGTNVAPGGMNVIPARLAADCDLLGISAHNAGMKTSRLVPCLFLLSAFSSPAWSSSLYRCLGADGNESIQSEPCPKGSKQVWKRDATPQADLTPEQIATLQARRDREAADARALARTAGTLRETPPVAAPPPPVAAPVVETPESPKGPCRRAHEFADAVRAKDWLEMRDDQLRRMDDWVAGQCQPPPEEKL